MLSALVLSLITSAPTVVVVPFATLSAQEYAPISHGAALAISAQILENKELNLITVPELAQILRKLDLTYDTLGHGSQAVEIAKMLGADYLITGSYQARWPDIQLTMKIVDGKDGSVKAETWELTKLEKVLTAFDDLSARSFPKVGWAKPKPGALGTSNIYAWREASLAAEILGMQPYGARPRTLVSANTLKKARLHCDEAVRLDPKWTYARGCQAMAIALEGGAVQNVEGSPLGAFAVYLTKLKKGEEKEALAAIDAASKNAPGMLALYLVASEHQQIRGAHADAKKTIDRWVARAPENPLALVRLGKSLVALGDGDKALDATKKALERSGNDPLVLVDLGSRLIDLQRYDEAEATLKRAMGVDKRDGRAYLRLGYLYLLKKKPAEAIAVLEKSIAESDLEDEWRARAWAHFDLARAHGQVGAIDKAFKELELAVESGFDARAKMEGEADLAVLTKDPRWPGLLEKVPAK